MKQKLPSLIVASYLLLCIVLGGSAQGVWGNLALQILGIALIAVSALSFREGRSGMFPAALGGFMFLGLVVVLLQLVPLPAGIWMELPGRAAIAAGFAALGMDQHPLPISETPYRTILTLFAAIPAIALILTVGSLRPSQRWIAAAVVMGAIGGVILGAAQVAAGPNSWAYLYRITNPGAVGFFANQNHMATLLLISIPMIAAGIATGKSDGRSTTRRYTLGASLMAVILTGIALNGSLAGYILVIPVLLASACLLPSRSRWQRLALPLSLLTLVGAVAFLFSKPIAGGEFGADASGAVTSRMEIWHSTTTAIKATFPIGTGLGSFEEVYHQYENSSRITTTYVNHAHNDYLELALELGVAGILLIAAFLVCWFYAAIRIWRSHVSTSTARAATIASAAILAHSIVDFPLRTAAISAVFAACLGVMAQHFQSSEQKKGDSRPTRHVELG